MVSGDTFPDSRSYDVPGISDALIRKVEPYEAESLLVRCLAIPSGTYGGYEHLAVAIANADGPQSEDPTDEVVAHLVMEAERDLGDQLSELPELQRLLRKIRDIRPAWYACPCYVDLLNPFDSRIRGLVGHGVAEIFDSVENVDNTLREQQGGRTMLPGPLRPLYGDLAIHWTDIETAEDVYSHAFMTTSWGLLVLSYKLPELTYRLLCDKLERSWSKFNDRKGDALEDFVQKRLEGLAPGWDWYQAYGIDGVEGEKDHIGVSQQAGIPVESKCLRLRPSSATWAHLNAESDIKERLGKAWKQLRPAIDLVEAGGSVSTDAGTVALEAKDHVQGIIVTDHTDTPYVRACLDSYLEDAPDDIYREPGWHGDDVWVVSFIDLDLVLQLAGDPAVLLDYLRYIRSRQVFRLTDEPESWLAYGMEPALKVGEAVQANAILNGFGWEKLREEGPDGVGPPWLARREEVEKWQRIGRMGRAFRLLEQDREKMERRASQRQADIESEDIPELA